MIILTIRLHAQIHHRKINYIINTKELVSFCLSLHCKLELLPPTHIIILQAVI